jgi:hypothetical protein
MQNTLSNPECQQSVVVNVAFIFVATASEKPDVLGAGEKFQESLRFFMTQR